MSSNVNRDCREIDGANFIPTHSKDAVFYNGKIYWLHMRIISQEYALYSYTMWSLDIGLNKWAGHAIHTGCIKRSMCLTIHQNQLLCLVNDGRKTIWSITEMIDLRIGASTVEEVHGFWIFGRDLRWTLFRGYDIPYKHTLSKVPSISGCGEFYSHVQVWPNPVHIL